MIPLASHQMICNGSQHLCLAIIFHISITIYRIHPCPLRLYSNQASCREWETTSYSSGMSSGKSRRIGLSSIAKHGLSRIIAPIGIGNSYSRVIRKLRNICNTRNPDLRDKETEGIIYTVLI